MPQPTTNLFSIIELINYARGKGQTGRLLFLEGGEFSAEIFFKKGHLRHAKNKSITGNEAVYQLLDNRTAQVRWERNAAPAETSIGATEENVLLGAFGLLPEKVAFPAQTANLEPPPAVKPVLDGLVELAPGEELPLTGPLPTRPEALAQSRTSALSTASANALTEGAARQPDESAETGQITAEQFRQQLGEETLRPPRFRRWSGLPLPFVSAFGFLPEDGLVKTAYETLWKARFSGFVTLAQPGGEGFSLFYRGRIVHSRFAGEGEPGFLKDQDATRQLSAQQIQKEDADRLLVYPLDPEFVHSYSALIIGEPELKGMSSQSVKLNKLLNTLEQANRTGVVHVNSGSENGYIFLGAGRKLGSYHEVEGVLEESILRVYQVMARPASTLEVLTSPTWDKLFEYASRPRSVRETKLQLVGLAEEIFGKRSNRVVQLVIQAEDTLPALTDCCNQARRVAQLFIDKNLADTFYERATLLLQDQS